MPNLKETNVAEKSAKKLKNVLLSLEVKLFWGISRLLQFEFLRTKSVFKFKQIVLLFVFTVERENTDKNVILPSKFIVNHVQGLNTY